MPESRGGQPARDRREVCGGAQVNARGQKDHKEAAGLANKVGKEIFPEEHFREIRGSHREISTRKYTTGRSERSGWAKEERIKEETRGAREERRAHRARTEEERRRRRKEARSADRDAQSADRRRTRGTRTEEEDEEEEEEERKKTRAERGKR